MIWKVYGPCTSVAKRSLLQCLDNDFPIDHINNKCVQFSDIFFLLVSADFLLFSDYVTTTGNDTSTSSYIDEFLSV